MMSREEVKRVQDGNQWDTPSEGIRARSTAIVHLAHGG